MVVIEKSEICISDSRAGMLVQYYGRSKRVIATLETLGNCFVDHGRIKEEVQCGGSFSETATACPPDTYRNDHSEDYLKF